MLGQRFLASSFVRMRCFREVLALSGQALDMMKASYNSIQYSLEDSATAMLPLILDLHP